MTEVRAINEIYGNVLHVKRFERGDFNPLKEDRSGRAIKFNLEALRAGIESDAE